MLDDYYMSGWPFMIYVMFGLAANILYHSQLLLLPMQFPTVNHLIFCCFSAFFQPLFRCLSLSLACAFFRVSVCCCCLFFCPAQIVCFFLACPAYSFHVDVSLRLISISGAFDHCVQIIKLEHQQKEKKETILKIPHDKYALNHLETLCIDISFFDVSYLMLVKFRLQALYSTI